MHVTMLVSYATHDLYMLTHIPTCLCMQICSQVVSQNSYLHLFHYYVSEITMATTLSATLAAHGGRHKRLQRS